MIVWPSPSSARGFEIERGFDVDREIAIDLPARRIACGLRLLAVVEHAHDGLQMVLRLHVAAHHTEAHDGFTLAVDLLREECRNDRMEWTLAALDDVRGLRFHREAAASVLQRNVGIGHDHTRAEPM